MLLRVIRLSIFDNLLTVAQKMPTLATRVVQMRIPHNINTLQTFRQKRRRPNTLCQLCH